MPCPLQLEVGKRECLRSPAPPPSGTPTLARLLYVSDGSTTYMVDTGAQVSVLPSAQLPVGVALSPCSTQLSAANGSNIKTHGSIHQAVQLGNHHLPWQFLIADVQTPIIGADFLQHYELAVDLSARTLLLPSGDILVSGSSPTSPGPTVQGLQVCTQLQQLWDEFPELTRPPSASAPVRHAVQHHITTSGPPKVCRARRLAPDRLSVAKAEVQELLRDGTLRPSKSEWASPIHLAPKGDGQWRLCGDYKALNSVTIPDRYPIPHLQDFSADLHGCRFFSKLDLRRAFYQVPVRPSDVKKTAIITPFGLYEAVRMPFGLRNAAQTCQRLMDDILRGVPGVFVYIDDILVATPTLEEHDASLRETFQRLSHHGIIVNRHKCVLGVPQLVFLGHLITPEGIAPLPARVEAVRDYPLPSTDRQLRRFIGLMNFYHRFIPGAARLMAPLHQLTSRSQTRRDTPVTWTAEAETAFSECKTALSEATLLTHPVRDAPISIQVDASDAGVGAVLQQYACGTWQPLGFYSRSLQKPQRRYSTFGRELLAIYMAIRHFRYAVEGRPLIIFTDHKPLTFAIANCSERHNPREARHIEFVAQFTTDVRHVPGKNNIVADALSRTVSMLTAPVPAVDNFDALATSQQEDAELARFRTGEHSLQLHARLPSGRTLVVDDSTGVPRPWIPAHLRPAYFRHVHELAHPGVRATVDLVTRRFVWPSVKRDVTRWTRCCISCQRNKTHRHVKTPLAPFTPPAGRFQHLHVDIVGPLPPSEGYQYLLTVVDRFTRWPEAVPLRGITAAEVARALVSGWISRFGVPDEVTTDRGSQFQSALWAELSALLGCRRRRTTAYHPQANGMVERLHRQLKAALRSAAPTRWTEALPLVLLGIRSALKTDIGCCAAELVYGCPLRLPGELVSTASTPTALAPASFAADLRRTMQALQYAPPRAAQPRSHVPRDLQDAGHVFVRRDAVKPPLTPPYDGPFRVVERGTKTVTIARGDRYDVVSLDRVKAAHLDPEPVTAAGRSRPPPAAPADDYEGPEIIVALPAPTSAPPSAPRRSTSAAPRPARSDRPPPEPTADTAPPPARPVPPTPVSRRARTAAPVPAPPARAHRTQSGRTVRFKTDPDFQYF